MKYNKPEFEINSKALDQYSIIAVVFPGYKTGIFDLLERSGIEENIVSLYCERYDERSKSTTSYLLVKKGSFGRIKQTLIEQADKEAAIYEALPSAIDQNSLINLLIRSIPYFSFGNGNSSNAGGYLFYYVGKSSDDPEQFVAVSVHYTKKEALDLSLKTFSSELIKNRIGGDKRWSKKAKFVLQGTRIKRAQGDTDEKRYIIAQKDGVKSSLDYFRKDYDGYGHSKSGILERFLLDLSGIPFIRLRSFSDLPDLEHIRLQSIALAAKDLMKQVSLYMPTICIQNETNEDIEKDLKEAIDASGYTGMITEGEYPTIRILAHDAEYYQKNGIEDPYRKGSLSIQHLVLENIKKKTDLETDEKGNQICHVRYRFDKAMIRNCLVNLCIKQDIRDGKLRLFDWQEKIGTKTDVYMMYEDEPYGMMIEKDGSFRCEKIEDDEMMDLLLGLFGDDVEMIIHDELWYLISDTEYTTIADRTGEIMDRIARAKEAVKKQKGWKKNKEGELEPRMISTDGISNKETREEYLPSLIDIHCAMKDDEMWYSVGLPGNGLKTIPNAIHIRKVIGWDGDKKSPAWAFLKYMCTMSVAFVANGRPTVFPFMRKYLMEFCRMGN